jgi:hypothetical protein
MGFPKKEILIACVNTSFVLKILKTTRNKQRFPNKEMLMSYMTKLPFLEIDSNRFEIDSNRFEIDSNRFEIDSNRFEIDSNRFEIDSNRFEIDSNRFEIDSNRFEIDSNRFEIDSNRLEIDSIRLEIDSIRLEIDSISSCSLVFINVQATSWAGNIIVGTGGVPIIIVGC